MIFFGIFVRGKIFVFVSVEQTDKQKMLQSGDRTIRRSYNNNSTEHANYEIPPTKKKQPTAPAEQPEDPTTDMGKLKQIEQAYYELGPQVAKLSEENK